MNRHRKFFWRREKGSIKKTSRIILITVMIVLGAFALVTFNFSQGSGSIGTDKSDEPSATALSAVTLSTRELDGAHPSFLYGRITTKNDITYEGRLRFGGNQEACWNHYFNGVKDENPWSSYLPVNQVKKRRKLKLFGFEFNTPTPKSDFDRPFMVRFGDIALIENNGTKVRVTLKGGTTFDLDRFEASDFDDGVRVWDQVKGMVDLEPRHIRAIKFIPTTQKEAVPHFLHGTVRTDSGDFTGYILWDQSKCLGSDEFVGTNSDATEFRLHFDMIRSIERHTPDNSVVAMINGNKIVLSGTHVFGHGNRGILIHFQRLGRVLVSWDVFERVDFSPTSSGPTYNDFPPGRPLTGKVTTSTGKSLNGRLVFDLDESETTETLDASSKGVHYTIPFGQIKSIDLSKTEKSGSQHVRLVLINGETLQLERTGDLSEKNAGILVFVQENKQPDYLMWKNIMRIDFDKSGILSSGLSN